MHINHRKQHQHSEFGVKALFYSNAIVSLEKFRKVVLRPCFVVTVSGLERFNFESHVFVSHPKIKGFGQIYGYYQ